MKYLDLSFISPAENLACDEALLESCESGKGAELLRFWESPTPFVVAGIANRLAREVHSEICRTRQIPMLRRCTGGGTVVQGPGCLNYALFLRIDDQRPVANVTSTNRYIMEAHRDLFRRLLGRDVQVNGHTDLVVEGRKFSGNAQRRKRDTLLFHGTILLHFDLNLVSELLPRPSQEPAYRVGREHADFLCNLGLGPSVVKEALRETWHAPEAFSAVPWSGIGELVKAKYSQESWNERD